MNDSVHENQHKLLVTGNCTNKYELSIGARRTKERNRKREDRHKRINEQIQHDKLKDRLQKRKGKCQQTEADNENHRIKIQEAVTRCCARKTVLVLQPEDVLLKKMNRRVYLNARTDDQKDSSKKKACISHRIWRKNRNEDEKRSYNAKESKRKRNAQTTKCCQKLFNSCFGNVIHGVESYNKPTHPFLNWD